MMKVSVGAAPYLCWMSEGNVPGFLRGPGVDCLRVLESLTVVLPALESKPEVDWSPAVMCWCKALEIEVARIVLGGWRGGLHGFTTRGARDVAAFMEGSGKAPGLGLSAEFIRYARRRDCGGGWLAGHPCREWIFDRQGLSGVLEKVARTYRNPAAHLGLMTREDYAGCAAVVGGAEGALSRLWGLAH